MISSLDRDSRYTCCRSVTKTLYVEEVAEKETRCAGVEEGVEEGSGSRVSGLRGKVVVMVKGKPAGRNDRQFQK
jgi:hypothetical protein